MNNTKLEQETISEKLSNHNMNKDIKSHDERPESIDDQYSGFDD